MVERYIDYYSRWLAQKCTDDSTVSLTDDDFFEIVEPVIEMIYKNSDMSVDELKELLFERSGLTTRIKQIVQIAKKTPGLVLSYGTPFSEETVVIGKRREKDCDNNMYFTNSAPMLESSIFDLDSLTELFTSVCILKLIQEGTISFEDKIGKLDSRFSKLDEVTIRDLLTYQLSLKGSDTTSIFVRYPDKRAGYNDKCAVILKNVLECVTGKDYYAYLNDEILKPFGLVSTFDIVSLADLDKLVSTSLEGRMYADFDIIRKISAGTPMNRESVVYSSESSNISGYAGLFSTANDLVKFSSALMQSKILSEQFLKELGTDHTSVKYSDGTVTQSLGCLTFAKSEDSELSQVPSFLGTNAFAGRGRTTHMVVVPANKVYSFVGTNHTHNRVSYIDTSRLDSCTESGESKIAKLKVNRNMFVSENCLQDCQKDIVDPALKLALQYRILEDYFQVCEKSAPKVRVLK